MKLRTIIILVIVATVLVGMKLIFFPASGDTVKGPAMDRNAPSNISAHIVNPERIDNEAYASGTVMANEEVLLQPELPGKIIKIGFQEGQSVQKGQLLIKINDADLRAQYKKLELQYALAEVRMKRQEQLLSVQGISQEEFDVARNQFQVIIAEMEQAAAEISKTEIRAPFNGVIGLKNVSEGAFVNQATVIATIQQISPVKIDFSISERYSSLVKKGDQVFFTPEGSKEKFEAKVYAVEPRIDMATRSLHIRALSANTGREVYPGSFVRVRLALSSIDSALMIPSEAIVPVLKGQKVFKIKNGKALSVKVETGIRDEKRIQITEGLRSGDTIAVTGIMQIRDGAPVKIIEIIR